MTRYIQHDEMQLPKLLKEGRGKGNHGSYSPFIWTTDFSSRGTDLRTPSIRFDTVRSYQLLSSWESLHMYCVESLASFDDFQEQYYLPLEETVRIATALGVKHPRSSKGHLWLMTTDALITLKYGAGKVRYARTIKPSDALTPTNIAKFEIERRYWMEQGVRWNIVTERDIPLDFARNWSWLREKYNLADIPPDVLATVEAALLKLIQKHSISLASSAMQCDRQLGLEAGTSLDVAYHLIAHGKWVIDLFQPLQPEHPLHLLEIIQAGGNA